MLKRTHIKIAEEVAYRSRYKLTRGMHQALIKGSVEPDKQKNDKKAHHHGREKEIALLILSARKAFLQGIKGAGNKKKLEESAYLLGRAFHFIADGCTTSSKVGIDHHEWEEEVARSYINKLSSDELGSMKEAIVKAINLIPKGNPRKELNNAIEICLFVTNSIWSPPL
ncbi:hypothetical protein J7M02_03015 [Candidatus Aerophobetes bacterium]|nr:hypothetical protein [Candidatus Aerophobetes bacterium]